IGRPSAMRNGRTISEKFCWRGLKLNTIPNRLHYSHSSRGGLAMCCQCLIHVFQWFASCTTVLAPQVGWESIMRQTLFVSVLLLLLPHNLRGDDPDVELDPALELGLS